MRLRRAVHRADCGPPSSATCRQTRACLGRVPAFLLTAYLAVIFIGSATNRTGQQVGSAPPQRLGQLLQPAQWLAEVAWNGVTSAAEFTVVGLLAVLAAGRCRLPGDWPARSQGCMRLMLALLLGAGVAVCASSVRSGHVPAFALLALPLGSVALGTWIGAHATRPWPTCLWVLPKMPSGT